MKNKLNDDITKQTRNLLNLIMLIQRKCRENNLWLGAGCDPYKEMTDEDQQGPLVTKMYAMVKELRKNLNKR